MRSKAQIAGHPIHPMLVAFPIAFYTATLISFLIYRSNLDPFWFRMGFIANVAGVVCAVLAAIPGLIDYTTAIPKETAAKKTATTHMILNVSSLLLFALNLWLQYARWDQYEAPPLTNVVILPALGFLCTLGAGYFGWNLVQKHHVGVDLTPEQDRLDSSRESRTILTPSARGSSV